VPRLASVHDELDDTREDQRPTDAREHATGDPQLADLTGVVGVLVVGAGPLGGGLGLALPATSRPVPTAPSTTPPRACRCPRVERRFGFTGSGSARLRGLLDRLGRRGRGLLRGVLLVDIIARGVGLPLAAVDALARGLGLLLRGRVLRKRL
jgi:hypothetical protein